MVAQSLRLLCMLKGIIPCFTSEIFAFDRLKKCVERFETFVKKLESISHYCFWSVFSAPAFPSDVCGMF